jgi:tetratricopeptide (TPR) repeat protein/V8-like Glu-specific endopeptidase
MKSLLVLGSVAALVSFAPAAAAKSPAEIEQIAKSVSVEMITGSGSGVIVHRQNNLYTLVTNRHVVCGSNNCNTARLSKAYQLRTADGRIHRVNKSAVQFLKDSAGSPLDLAIVRFQSDHNYPIAQVGDPNSLKINDKVYTAGFPKGQGWFLGEGQTHAVTNKRLLEDRGGYTVIYNAQTLPGMSGGGAFDRSGRLVAIHGMGDRYTANTQSEQESSNSVQKEVNSKIGFNRGIPIRWVVQGLSEQGIVVGDRETSSQQQSVSISVTADEFFIAGFNKFVDPGENTLAGQREAVEQFSKAIDLNPNYKIAYFMRAYVRELLNESQDALADYNKAISLDPEYAAAYHNRGFLKYKKINDFQGALADYNRSIALNPQPEGYFSRGFLKQAELNDPQGALADYNKAITLNPKYIPAYIGRGNLKFEKLNDPQGALADYNKALSLNPQSAEIYSNRGFLKHEALNDPQGALADFNKSLSLNPQYSEAYNGRGNVKSRALKDSSGALADYSKAISLNPKSAAAYNNRANLKSQQLNDPQGALADYTQAIALNPKSEDTYINRGNMKLNQLNDPRGALDDYNQAIILNPKSAKAYFIRGFLKLDRLNDRPGAINDFRSAAKIFRETGSSKELQVTLDFLRELGATE